MENKIIKLTKVEPGSMSCLLCCDKDASVKISINRIKYENDVVTSFFICDECLAKMQSEIRICE